MKQYFLKTKTVFAGNLLLLVFFGLFCIKPFSAQTPGSGGSIEPETFCGTFRKLGDIPVGYNGDIYYDRFGNSYTLAELQEQTSNATQNCDQGVFHLNFINTPSNFQQTICDVFGQISTKVGGNAPIGIVPINIEWTGALGNSAGAAASYFMEADCGLWHSKVLEIIRTKTNSSPLGVAAGLIQINGNLNWYIGPDPSPNNIPTGQIDLYTAVLHEGLHLLGFASEIGKNGVGLLGSYSVWDKHLFQTDLNTPLLMSANDPSCCSKSIYNPNAPSDLTPDCDLDVFFLDFENSILAEVNFVGSNEVDDNDFRNKLSHLDIDCGNGVQYVMHPGLGISPNPFSKPRRDITEPELDILCNIGYVTTGDCLDCVIVAEDDYISQPIFLSGFNVMNLSIYASTFYDALLNNDIAPLGIYYDGIVELCGVSSGIQVEPINFGGLNYLEFQVTGLEVGNWTFCYRITSLKCPGVCAEATVHVTVVQSPIPLVCNNNDDCDLVCFGDFEMFEPANSNYLNQLNVPYFHLTQTDNNTVDVAEDNEDGNTLLRWFACESGFLGSECPRIPLSSPIMPGCDITIRFEATASLSSCSPPLPSFVPLGFYGLTGPPCIANTDPFCSSGPGGQFVLCPGVDAICLGSPGVEPDVDVLELSDNPKILSNLDLHEYIFTFTVPNSFPSGITDILVFGEEDFDYYLDNISVTTSCNSQISVTPTIVQQCVDGLAIIEYEVCLTGITSTPVPIMLQPQIPGLQVVPGGGFDINGQASFVLTPGLSCSQGAPNTTVLTLTLEIGSLDLSNGPVEISIPMQIPVNGICINPDINENGDVTLLIQDCTLDPQECTCPSNTGIPPIGMNEDSETYASTTALADVIDGECITINGKFFIDKNITFKNCDITLGKGAEIIVQDEFHLDLFYNLIQGCEYMWRSITVFGALHAENNTVRDAQWAVRAEDKSYIWVMNNVFDRDFVAFYVPEAQNGLNNVNTIRIKGNQVICPGFLKPAYGVADPDPSNSDAQWPEPGLYTFAGAYLNDVSGFDIGLNNVFDGIRNGVIAKNSVFSINTCVIENLISYIYPIGSEPGGMFNFNLSGIRTYDCPNAMIKNNEISDVFKGVFSERSNINIDNNTIQCDIQTSPTEDDEPWRASAVDIYFGTNRSTTIKNNTISSVGDGIGASICNPAIKLLISDNNITTIHPNPGAAIQPFGGISLNVCTAGEVAYNSVTMSTASKSTGLSLGSCKNIFIHDNELYDFELGMSGLNNVGCYLLGNSAKGDANNTAVDGFNNISSDNDYCCNEVDGLSGDGFIFDGPSTGTSYKSSQIYSAAFGLRLTESANIGSQNHARNRWYAGNTGAFHESMDPTLIQQSRFICELAFIPPYATAADMPGAPIPWFFEQALPPGPTQPLCNCPYPNTGGGGDLPRIEPEIDDITAKGEHYLGQYSNAYNWITQQRLYERLDRAPQLANTSAFIDTFYHASLNGVIGQYNALTKEIEELISRDAFSKYTISQSIEQQNFLLEELSLLNQDPSATSIQQRIKAHQLFQEVSRYESYLTAVEQQQNNEIGSLLLVNDNLPTNLIFQSNEKSMNRIILENKLWGKKSLPNVDLSSLNLIATQCPLSGGLSVYLARSIATALGESGNWVDDNFCDSIVSERNFYSKKKDRPMSLSLYPNPANQNIIVYGFDLGVTEKTIEISSITGEKVLALSLRSDQQFMKIDTHQLPNGLYLFKVCDSNNVFQSGKFVISH